tara:strand:+ start:628 stop:882 length:255 start_codon:yes stop_codon:yes gene_type:complete
MDRLVLEKLTLKELKEIVKQNIGKGYSKLNKNDLIDILAADEEPEPEPEPEPEVLQAPAEPSLIPHGSLLFFRVLEKDKVKNKC